jgi:dynamin 1-like protein
MHHIRATLPDIKARIGQQLAKYSAELKALGGAMGETNPVSNFHPQTLEHVG